MLYEMLTGEPLFGESSAAGWALAHVRETPRRPAVRGARMEGPLIDLVGRCLAKDPAQRPPSAALTLAALQQIRPHAAMWPVGSQSAGPA